MKPPDVLIFSLSFVFEMKQLHHLFRKEGLGCRYSGLTFAVLWSSLLLLNIVGRMAEGHVIFWEPPSRASLGKHNMNFCKVPINDDHMSLYCGGIKVSESTIDNEKAQCSICFRNMKIKLHSVGISHLYCHSNFT